MADEFDQIGQDEIEELLKQAKSDSGPAAESPPAEKATPEADDGPLDQSDIEALLGGAGAPAKPPATPVAPAPSSLPPETPTKEFQSDVELLLNKAEEAIASIDQSDHALPAGVKPFDLSEFSGTPASAEAATLELVRDVQLDLKIELGRTHMHLEEVLRLKQGAVVPLDKLAGDPVDVYVNGRLIARGEVLVLNDNFCVRVTELIVGENAA